MKLLLAIWIILLSSFTCAAERFVSGIGGDHYVFIPEEKAEAILVVAHGMLSKKQKAKDVARKFFKRWAPYAVESNLVLIVPVFDTSRFGNLKGGYGGYRNLFGRIIGADEFINQLGDTYAKNTKSASNKFYLYGHSAGGQFVARYTVRYPQRVIHAVISAAGRYSYPTYQADWPYGAGKLHKKIVWDNGATSVVKVSPSLDSYAKAASLVDIVVGLNDTKVQPVRPAHIGSNRIEFAYSWAKAMNLYAINNGKSGDVTVYTVSGAGHNSAALTKKAAYVLLKKNDITSL